MPCSIKQRPVKAAILNRLDQVRGFDVSDIWNWENNWVSPAAKFIPAIVAFLDYNPRPKPEALPDQLV
jgi:hypothetical protein